MKNIQKSVSEIKKEFELADKTMVMELMTMYKDDMRAGVQKQLEKVIKEQKKLEDELDRLEMMNQYEREYDAYDFICGIDEVGRGPLAGPVVAAAVILPKNSKILYINDSKKLSEKKREELYDIIVKEAISFGIGIVDSKIVDEINILQATYEAMRIAIGKLSVAPQVLLNDAVTIPGVDKNIIQVPIIKGDAKSVSIAAASIVAKVTRDKMMEDFDKEYPEYGFKSNKGYGAATHIEAIKKVGPCKIHRTTFIKNL